MVSPNEIDKDLEEDVLEECTKYGKVNVNITDKFRFD
jgi:hypothetical protein